RGTTLTPRSHRSPLPHRLIHYAGQVVLRAAEAAAARGAGLVKGVGRGHNLLERLSFHGSAPVGCASGVIRGANCASLKASRRDVNRAVKQRVGYGRLRVKGLTNGCLLKILVVGGGPTLVRPVLLVLSGGDARG